MKIPKESLARDQFFSETIQKCLATCDDREREYGVLRNFYLFGAGPDEDEAPFNKIYPSIDLLVSFLFAAETTRFSTHFPADESDHEYDKLEVFDRAVNDEWLNSNADMVFSMALTWSLVHNSSFVKLVVRGNQLNPFVVDAANIGVLREDVAFLDRQEAIVHKFYTTKAQLRRDLELHPQREAIIGKLQESRSAPQQPASGLDRVITSAVSPNMVGNAVTPILPRNQYIPKVDEDVVEMFELWVWDDEERDYRVVTRSENDITVYDRPNFWLPGEHPFVQVCPSPIPGYLWGRSEVAGLISLQRLRNHRMNQVMELLDKQAKPPKAVIGMGGLAEEKLYALNVAGGIANSTEPMGKVEEFAPKMPEDLFREIHEIDQMFAEMTGLQNILQGKGESGVRSGRQTSELARLSSARIRKRALTIEDSLERMATLYGKFLRKYRKADYVDSKGVPFLANQFPEEFVVKVDAHSNSPIFVEDQKSMASELLEAAAIDRESYLDMMDPPGKELLKRKLKVIEAEEKKQQAQQQQAEAAKGGGKP
jgi:hypothetical protein